MAIVSTQHVLRKLLLAGCVAGAALLSGCTVLAVADAAAGAAVGAAVGAVKLTGAAVGLAVDLIVPDGADKK